MPATPTEAYDGIVQSIVDAGQTVVAAGTIADGASAYVRVEFQGVATTRFRELDLRFRARVFRQSTRTLSEQIAHHQDAHAVGLALLTAGGVYEVGDSTPPYQDDEFAGGARAVPYSVIDIPGRVVIGA